MNKVLRTFLDLAAIDEVHPNEHEVLKYVSKRLTAADVPYKQDKMGNIVARIRGTTKETVAIAGHVDIAAPLQGRQIIVEGDIIKTDGKSLLGGDDKTAVAAMLELADYLHAHPAKPAKTIELIFTVGEESGLRGSRGLDYSQVTATQVLVFDWVGSVNRIVTQSPSYYCFDVTYKGKDAHPAEWQHGKNAGAALLSVSAGLQQGEYAPGVTFNIGTVQIGNARNKVPGLAELRAEARSFDRRKIMDAAKEIETAFGEGMAKHHLTGNVTVYGQCEAYHLNKQSPLLAKVTSTLQAMELDPVFETTYGCFDGNVFAQHGMDVVIQGAAYYNPHSPDEYVKISELNELLTFLQHFVL